MPTAEDTGPVFTEGTSRIVVALLFVDFDAAGGLILS